MSNQQPNHNNASSINNNNQHHLVEEDEASRQRHQYTLRGLAAVPAGAAEQQRSSAPRPPPPAINNSNNPQAALRQQALPSMVQQQQQQQQIPPAPAVNPPSQPQRGPFARSNNNNNDLQQPDASQFAGNGRSFASLHPRDNPELQVIMEEDDSSSIGWSEVETNGVPPSARSLHSAALLNGVLYVFGGYDGSQRVNSFHAYSFMEKRWSPVLPSANSGPPPSPRDRHASVAYANSFFVHGGFDGSARDSSLFAFDFSTMAWREVTALSGRPPSARHSHAAVVHGHSMFIFGGYDGSYKSDLHEFDFSLSRWSAVPAAGRRPRARYRATCAVYKNWMILYGGHDGTRHLSDTFIFDFDTKTWSALLTEGTCPIPRDSHVSVVHGNSMYVFGGSSGSAMNDLHELQLPDATTTTSQEVARWRPVHTPRADQPRHRFCHVAVTYNDSMWVFGGYDGADRLNSFIKFDFTVYDRSFDIPPSTILSDFRSLVNNETLSDVTFIVEGRPVYAHKLLLMRCSYFEALFLGQMRESTQDTIHIDSIRYQIFLMLLEYLYTDQLSISFADAMEIFEAADHYGVHRLKMMCEKRMLQAISVENAAGIFHAADLHSATALRAKTKKYILTHFEAVTKTSSFEEMGRRNIDLVFELLQSR